MPEQTTDMREQTIFLSYARRDDEDRPFVKRLWHDLEAVPGISLWWDQERMESRGWTFLQEIRKGIAKADRLIAIVGPHALSSKYVAYEWDYARRFCKGVVPILRDGDWDDRIPDKLRNLDYTDFRDEEAYDDALEDLLRKLRREMKEPGRLNGVPTPPHHFVPRPDAIDWLEGAVLADVTRGIVVTPAQQVTMLHGMGGVGKSVLAAAFATQVSTRRAFSDDEPGEAGRGGIIWLQSSDKEHEQRDNLMKIGKHFGEDVLDADREHYGTRDDAKRRLQSEVIRHRSLLIVLDDVQSDEEVTLYRDCISDAPRCRLLVTSRRALPTVEAQSYLVEPLGEDEALQLLRLLAEPETDRLPDEARQVAARVGNLPLALALCGAMKKSKLSTWSGILGALEDVDLGFIRGELEHVAVENENLLTALRASVKVLDESKMQHYHELAVFPKHTADPEAAVVTLWLHTDGLAAERYARLLLSEMDLQYLLSLEGEEPDRRMKLHPLQHDYVRAVIEATGDMQDLHRQMVEAYRAKCACGWHAGPDDGYFFEFLPHHLEQAGRSGELRALLLDYRWLRARLDATSYWDILRDYERLAGDESYVVATVAENDEGSPEDKARILRELGTIYEELGRRTTAEHALTAAEQLARELGDEVLLASILTELGKVWFHQTRFGESRRAHDEALQLHQAHPDDDPIAYGWCLEWHGEQHRNVFEMERALELHQRACEVADRAGGDRIAALQLKAHATGNVGAVHYWQKDYEAALERWKEAEDLSTQAGDVPRVAHYKTDVGYVCLLLRRYEEALGYLEAGIELARKVRSHEGHVRGTMNMASVRFAQGDLEEARSLYEEALRLSAVDDVPRLTWRIHHNLGNVHLRLDGDITRAEHEYRAAIAAVEEMMATYPTEEKQRSFLRHRLNPYRAMILLRLEQGDRDGARAVSDRDASLQDFLARREQGVSLALDEAGNMNFFDGYYVETE